MSTFFSFVAGFFREDSQESSTRALMIGTWGIIVVVYAYLAVKQEQFPQIPESLLVLLSGPLALKGWQKRVEAKSKVDSDASTNEAAAQAQATPISKALPVLSLLGLCAAATWCLIQLTRALSAN